jgi:hypothetical protein
LAKRSQYEETTALLFQPYICQAGSYSIARIPAYRLPSVYSVKGTKDPALKAAERAVTIMPRAKDAFVAPILEENLALIQAIVGENRPAISILTELLQTPYLGLYQMPITPAFLRLDPFWDPLRGDPSFQKLCEEKQP